MLYVTAVRLRMMRPIHRQSSVRHVRERRKEMKVYRKVMVLALAVALPLTSCAAIQRSEVRDEEQLLATAGFQAKSADTPEKLANLRTVLPRELVSQEKDGNVGYSYADPDYCQCLYVGGVKEYSAYQRLAAEKKIEQDRLNAARWPIHR
jgi:hypothetical protein